MCWKKIFGSETVTPITGEKVLLSFAINDYPGSTNDLNGCLNDQLNVVKTLLKYWPDFQVKKFADGEVTKARYKKELTEALKRKWDTVLILQDCCFSEDNTRALHGWRARFVSSGPGKKIKKRTTVIPDIKYLAFSACQDYQTAADAYINGSYNGAFTWFACKSLHPDMTYGEWCDKTKYLLSESSSEQIPELQGPDYLINKKVFSDKTLVVHYSGHGTYGPDKNEPDGQYEAMYLYDGALPDDELSLILANC